MRKWFSFILIATVTAAYLALVAGPALAAEFSADTESVMSFMPDKKITGKVYVKGNKYRMEMTMPGGVQGIIIGDNDAKTIYSLTPQTGTYMEVPAGSKEIQGLPGNPIPKEDADSQELGTETVSGYECKKTKYIFKEPQRGTAIFWMSPKLNYALKYEVAGPAATGGGLLLNIKEGSQPDDLFKVPADYKKFTMPQMPPGVKMPQGMPPKK